MVCERRERERKPAQSSNPLKATLNHEPPLTNLNVVPIGSWLSSCCVSAIFLFSHGQCYLTNPKEGGFVQDGEEKTFLE